jgi:flagellar biosynthesis protein FlhG
MVILPVGSGKGGVGKSLLAANLSIALAEAGRRVVLADLDLGASNLHTMLGIRGVREGIGTFLTVPRMAFADILLPTEYPGLAFIAGDAEVPGAANLKPGQRRRLVRHLQSLDCDFLVLDLGPGTAAGTLEFFLLAGSGIVITTPALTAILNAYLFLKNAVFRLMYDGAARDSRAYEVLESLRRESGALQRAYVPRILARIAEEDPESGRAIGALLARFKPLLVLNMLEQPGDVDRADRLRRSAREYLGVDLAHLGVMYSDELQSLALSSRLPLVRYKPHSVLSQAIHRIAGKLLETSIGDVDESFHIAEEEAESDFRLARRLEERGP